MAARLGRDRDFLLFVGGQAVSLTGSAVTRVAVPLVAVVTLAATPLEVGLVAACAWLPFLGLPLLTGVYVDRRRKRPILIGTNAVRAVLLGLVPLLWVAGALSVPVLCLVALASGVAEVVFQIAELAYVPVLVGRDRVLGAYSGIEVARHTAELSGPGLAGVLVQAVGAPLAVLADAVSYVVSTVTLASIRRPEPAPVPGTAPHFGRELASGLRLLWGLRPVRVVVIQLFFVNLAWQAFEVAFVVYGVRDRGVPPGLWGLILSVSGAAAVLSALVAPRVSRRLGHGPAILAFAFLLGLPMLLVPAIDGPLWMLVVGWSVALALTGLGGGGFNVLASALRVAYTPDGMLGRVGASGRQLVFAGTPLGGLLGGTLAGALGSRGAIWVAALIATASLAVLLPIGRVRVLPTAAPAVPDAARG